MGLRHPGLLVCTRLVNSVLYSGILVVETRLSTPAPQFFGLFPASPVKQNSAVPACPDRKVFPGGRRVGTSADHSYTQIWDAASWDAPDWDPAPQLHITHQLCHSCRMPREKMWVTPVAWGTEKMSINASRPYLHHLKRMNPFSFKPTEYLLWRPMLLFFSSVLHPCLPAFLQSPGETTQVV